MLRALLCAACVAIPAGVGVAACASSSASTAEGADAAAEASAPGDGSTASEFDAGNGTQDAAAPDAAAPECESLAVLDAGADGGGTEAVVTTLYNGALATGACGLALNDTHLFIEALKD